MTLTVTFKIGTDPDLAQQLVQNRVNQAEPRLPEEVRRLGVTTVKSAVDLTMVVHLVSPNERYDMTYLRNYGVLNVKDRLARIEGVGQVLMWGSGDYSMRVWLDPRKVAERNLSAGDVVRAIRQENVQAAAGIVGASPGVDKVDLQLSVNAQGRLQTEEEFGDIIVKSEGSAVTRLRDVARIELGASDYALRSLLDNKPAVAIGVFAAPGANALQISDNVRAHHGRHQEGDARGRRLRDRLRPDAVRARLDQGGGAHAARGDRARGAGGDPVPADLARLDHPAGGGAGVDRRHLLAALSCSASRSTRSACSAWCWRSASWWTTPSWWWRTSSATSPQGLSPREATYQAMKEVTNPIIAIALVLVAVFVPLAFISGLSGQFYKQFAMTIAISTVISAINSLTLSPALAALLLKPHEGKKTNWFFRGFNRYFGRASNGYSRGVGARAVAQDADDRRLRRAARGHRRAVQGGARAASCRSRTSST